MTIEELIQSPKSLTNGCVFQAQRNGFVRTYKVIGVTSYGINGEDGYLAFFMPYSELSSDPSFTIVSRPKRKFSFLNFFKREH